MWAGEGDAHVFVRLSVSYSYPHDFRNLETHNYMGVPLVGPLVGPSG